MVEIPDPCVTSIQRSEKPVTLSTLHPLSNPVKRIAEEVTTTINFRGGGEIEEKKISSDLP